MKTQLCIKGEENGTYIFKLGHSKVASFLRKES